MRAVLGMERVYSEHINVFASALRQSAAGYRRIDWCSSLRQCHSCLGRGPRLLAQPSPSSLCECHPLQTDYPLDRRVGPEAKKSYREKVESGFLPVPLRPCVLDIGHKGADAEQKPSCPTRLE